MDRYDILEQVLERNLLPDRVLRLWPRVGVHARLRSAARGGVEAQEARLHELIERMSTGPIAEAVGAAGEQHHELPPAFFGLLLGPRRKDSGCLWTDGVGDLAGAEEAMLELTCARAQIADGMRVLDLGCGWGSMSLWVAERYPACSVVGVSNSSGQCEWVTAEAERRGLTNVEIRTEDIDAFGLGGDELRFDRVVSLETFEHMRNWQELLRRVSTWLADDGKLFVHVLSQRHLPHLFQGTRAAHRVFAAGLTPSHELMAFFQRDMCLERRWAVDGTHYARTLQAWLANLDAERDEALRILGRTNPPNVARRLLATWRLSLISTDVIWGCRGGDERLVSHYLLSPRRGATAAAPPTAAAAR